MPLRGLKLGYKHEPGVHNRREEEYFNAMADGSGHVCIGGLRGTEEESLAWLVSEGGFREGFLRGLTAGLRLK